MTSDPFIGSPWAAPLQRGVDIHCHLLPSIDDGPETVEQAIALARILRREGIETVIATPHQLGRYEGTNSAASVRTAVARFREDLDRFHIKLDVRPGAEVRLDERIATLLQRDQILTLADAGKYLLLELPSGLAFDVDVVVPRVNVPGVRIVLAHVERYDFLRPPGAAERWRDAGVILQVNASSLLGAWGAPSEQAGWDLLSRGVIGVIASDAHSPGQRRPRWSDAVRLIEQRMGSSVVQALCLDHPRRILNGEPVD